MTGVLIKRGSVDKDGGRATCRWTWDYPGASTGQGAPEAEKLEEMLKHIVLSEGPWPC